MLRTGGFNLRKFITNSSQLQERIDKEEGMLIIDPTSDEPADLEETYTRSTLGST